MGCGSSKPEEVVSRPGTEVRGGDLAESRAAAKAFKEKQAKLEADKKEKAMTEEAMVTAEQQNNQPVDNVVEDLENRVNTQAAADREEHVQQEVVHVTANHSLASNLDSRPESSNSEEVVPLHSATEHVKVVYNAHLDTISAVKNEISDEVVNDSVGHKEDTLSEEQGDVLFGAAEIVSMDAEDIICGGAAQSDKSTHVDGQLQDVQQSGIHVDDKDLLIPAPELDLVPDETNTEDTIGVVFEPESKSPDGKISDAIHKEYNETNNQPDSINIMPVNVMRGYLNRLGHVKKSWRRQYFVLDCGMMACYEEPQEEYPFGTGLKNYTTLTFAKAEYFEKECRLHVFFEEPSPEQQQKLDVLARHSVVTIMLDVGAVREHILQADTLDEFRKWKSAIQRHIEYADMAAYLSADLVFPPEAIPASGTMVNQVPVLERSFSKSGSYTGNRKSISFDDGNFAAAGAEEDERLGPIDEVTAEDIRVETTEESSLDPDLALQTVPESDTPVYHPSPNIALDIVEYDPVDDANNIAIEGNHDNAPSDPAPPAVLGTPTTVTGDTRSVGTASTEEEDEDGIVLDLVKPEMEERCLPKQAVPAVDVYKGYFLKQGHFFKNWKKRFFVLDNGILYYYEKECAEPPYGTGLKGYVPLLFAVLNSNQSTCRMHITFPPLTVEQRELLSEEEKAVGYIAGDKDEGKDLLLEADSLDSLLNWEICVRKHVDYSLSKIKQREVVAVSMDHKEAAAKPSKGGGRMKRASVLVRNSRTDISASSARDASSGNTC